MWLMTAAALAAGAPAPSLPQWMAGCWETHDKTVWVEECWSKPRAGIMLGSGRSGTGERLFNWEVMQIIRVDTEDPAIPQMTFYGAPGGKNRTPFTWIVSKDEGVTFVNAQHDYPQRIRYWREGRELVAEISLMDGSKAQRWRYTPKGD